MRDFPGYKNNVTFGFFFTYIKVFIPSEFENDIGFLEKWIDKKLFNF